MLYEYLFYYLVSDVTKPKQRAGYQKSYIGLKELRGGREVDARKGIQCFQKQAECVVFLLLKNF